MDDIIAISFETELGEDAVYRGAFTVVFDDLDPETPTPGPLPLGAEVAKRVDLYAVALHNGLTVDQLPAPRPVVHPGVGQSLAVLAAEAWLPAQ